MLVEIPPFRLLPEQQVIDYRLVIVIFMIRHFGRRTRLQHRKILSRVLLELRFAVIAAELNFLTFVNDHIGVTH
jgi:hypothetical protein